MAASGALFVVAGYALLVRLRAPAAATGTASEPDPEYLKIPADGKTDWMTSFTLTERSGQTVQWPDLQGKVRLVSFFFSSCPATCLQQNYKIREIQQGFAGKDFVAVNITCDPDTDTPERLREYAAKLEAPPEWLFLTGNLTYIRRVAGELFSVALDKQTHSERLIVCDKWGNIRGRYHWNKLDEVTELKQLVEKLLAETDPPAESGEQGQESGVSK
jgi:cytochrome oxidase Cu insertion factor (SCO1/SenC/PrrC family)